MKHHNHNIGWKRANYQDHIPVWKEVAALGACYAIVIGMTFVIVHVLAK